jgi:hypothetical protein
MSKFSSLDLPAAVTPEALAERLGWSARRVRDKAREIGACRILGNRMILLPQDVDAILEASRPCFEQRNGPQDHGGNRGPGLETSSRWSGIDPNLRSGGHQISRLRQVNAVSRKD